VKMHEGFVFGESNKTKEYLELHPLGTVPSMDHGHVHLTDSAAIAQYIAGLKSDHKLLGHTPAESALITQWLVFSSAHIEAAGLIWLVQALGGRPFNKPVYQHAQEMFKHSLEKLNRTLQHRTFLAAEHITLADIAVASSLHPFFVHLLSPEWRAPIKNVVRWYTTCMNQPAFKKVFGACVLAKEETKPPMPKKEEKKPKETKPAGAPKEAKKPAKDEDEEEEEEKPKPKSKLDLLPPTTFNLEDWKRFYSNNDTKPTAMEYFWKHYDPTGFSVWRVDYKYNNELKLIFMSSNLIGGFYNRIERVKKYGFGSLCVLGENNKNEVHGYMVLRGHEVPFEVTDAPDYESYEFTRVDENDPKVRELMGDYFAWEKEIEGKVFADGKVFK